MRCGIFPRHLFSVSLKILCRIVQCCRSQCFILTSIHVAKTDGFRFVAAILIHRALLKPTLAMVCCV